MALRIGITTGDSAGIGPEIVRAALSSGKIPTDAEYRVIGEMPESAVGLPTPATARAALAAMEEAAAATKAGELDAVVTGPIHKARMRDIAFAFPGQTEFFAARWQSTDYAMCLTADPITVALVTTHIALREVPLALRQSEIVRVGKLLAGFLKQRGRAHPLIVVPGLNPHAGESGNMGHEEIEIIAPAVAELSTTKIADFEGPLSADTLFFHLAQGKWDAALCLYHDQGLIPLKLHGFDRGVNVTLGLPYPRTSPDHGTAFEIAGKNIARPDSMIAAINLAVELAQ
ncbi:MAG: 4-hydroxythreonine-4-phosphate dehydrogenase PdxA [Verrucomicrobiota bacterium]|nr:4-hydroxythreonine-4-phosphate dehydrogenase PdxA [Verrucomicrobiota bacterium]